MSEFGLMLSPDSHDLVVANGRLQLVIDGTLVARNLETRLSSMKGEWILDVTYGYEFRNILGKRAADLQLIESSLKSYILETEHVVSIVAFKMSYLPGDHRRLVVSFSVLTTFGTIENIGGVTLG